MKLYNTLSRTVKDFKPLDGYKVRMYSCGPTVYDHIHIGNLSAFIAADTLRRTLQASGYQVQHVMNFTDVDDKTIRRSGERYPDVSPEEALKKLTDEYKQVFLADMQAIGNDTKALEFVNATNSIEGMRQLITELFQDGFAYIADDGVYFSIEKYRASGKKYGQLTEISEASTSSARIQNDEYDKESVHDFALWKTQKPGEPSWQFDLDGRDLSGRPGWHIECSVMSVQKLGQPFDIHTGGVDLIFPHHENEIAQSTAGNGDVYAKYFVHNEHLLVEGRKMSKSLNNFFTLRDIQEKGYDPLAFRLMVLQSHYRSQSNFTWENLDAAQNRLKKWQATVDLLHQAAVISKTKATLLQGQLDLGKLLNTNFKALVGAMSIDLDTPIALRQIEEVFSKVDDVLMDAERQVLFRKFTTKVDELLGLILLESKDISDEQKQILAERQNARDDKDFTQSDELRDQLKDHGIGVRDTDHGQIWYRL